MEELTDREHLIVTSLLSGKTKADTARELDISTGTIYRALARKHVKAKMKHMREEMRVEKEAAMSKYNDMVFDSLEVLHELLQRAEKDSDRIKIATKIVEGAPMMQEALEINVNTSPIEQLTKILDNIDTGANEKAYNSMEELEAEILKHKGGKGN